MFINEGKDLINLDNNKHHFDKKTNVSDNNYLFKILEATWIKCKENISIV